LTPGEALEVTLTVNFPDDNIGVADASVQCAGATPCTAQLMVYQPADTGNPNAPRPRNVRRRWRRVLVAGASKGIGQATSGGSHANDSTSPLIAAATSTPPKP
jgi:hypothetical protein